MADCSEISLMLGPFEDGELEPNEMQEVARHLASCKLCEKILHEYNLLGRELRGLLTSPSLEGFAEAVNARIQDLQVPWRARLERSFGSFKNSLTAAVAMGTLTAAVAILTAILVTPYVQHRIGHNARVPSLAKLERIEQQAPQVAAADLASAAQDSHAIISRLEAEMPSVAVWSEPQNDTTVIWLPEQPQ